MKIAHSLLSDFGILVNPIPIKGTDRFRPPHDYLSPPQIFKHSAGSEMYAMFDEFRTKQTKFIWTMHAHSQVHTQLFACCDDASDFFFLQAWRQYVLRMYYVCITTYIQGCRKLPKHTRENPISRVQSAPYDQEKVNVSAKNGGDETNPHVPVCSCTPDITLSSSKIGSQFRNVAFDS